MIRALGPIPSSRSGARLSIPGGWAAPRPSDTLAPWARKRDYRRWMCITGRCRASSDFPRACGQSHAASESGAGASPCSWSCHRSRPQAVRQGAGLLSTPAITRPALLGSASLNQLARPQPTRTRREVGHMRPPTPAGIAQVRRPATEDPDPSHPSAETTSGASSLPIRDRIPKSKYLTATGDARDDPALLHEQ